MLARFGLMHICATNICVWIRTLVLESLKEIVLYHQRRGPNPDDGAILESIRTHSLRHAGTVMGTQLGPDADWEPIDLHVRGAAAALPTGHHESDSILSRMVHTTARALTTASALTEATTRLSNPTTTTPTSTTTFRATRPPTTTTTTTTPSTSHPYESSFVRKLQDFVSASTAASPTISTESSNHHFADDDDDDFFISATTTRTASSSTSSTAATPTTGNPLIDFISGLTASTDQPPAAVTTIRSTVADVTTTISDTLYNMFSMDSLVNQRRNQTLSALEHSAEDGTFESMDALFPEALIGGNGGGGGAISNGGGGSGGFGGFFGNSVVPTAMDALGAASPAAAAAATNMSCGRVNIMGTIVQDSAPYLYPFVIEYSLIGAVVIYVMWKHIGRYPK